MHKGQDQVTFVEVYPGIALFFSRLYILLYIHMQNLLNWADRASTVPNRSSNEEFSGKNGALAAQTMTIPVTTCVNRDATVLNLGLTVLSQGQTVGVSSTCLADNGGDMDVAGVVPA